MRRKQLVQFLHELPLVPVIDCMFVFPHLPSYIEILVPSEMVFGGEAFGRLLSHEGRALPSWMGLAFLEKRSHRDISHPLPVMWGSEQDGSVQASGTWPCWNPDLELPASKTVRNKATHFMALGYSSPKCLRECSGSSLVVQWLRLQASNVMGLSLILGQETMTPCAALCS